MRERMHSFAFILDLNYLSTGTQLMYLNQLKLWVWVIARSLTCLRSLEYRKELISSKGSR